MALRQGSTAWLLDQIHRKRGLLKEIEAVKGLVYFILAVGADAVKIGYVANISGLERRINDLRVGNHCELRLIRLERGLSKVEKWFHNAFKELRIRGEWYKLDNRLLSLSAPNFGHCELSEPERNLVLAMARKADAEAQGLRVSGRLHRDIMSEDAMKFTMMAIGAAQDEAARWRKMLDMPTTG